MHAHRVVEETTLDTMGSPDNNSRDAELNLEFGSIMKLKEAASIPLPPSFSLNSTSGTVGSVMTVYYTEESDLRDETHHVDVAMDSMRDGAEDLSELLRSESSMSVVTEKAAAIENIQLPISRSTSNTSAWWRSITSANTKKKMCSYSNSTESLSDSTTFSSVGDRFSFFPVKMSISYSNSMQGFELEAVPTSMLSTSTSAANGSVTSEDVGQEGCIICVSDLAIEVKGLKDDIAFVAGEVCDFYCGRSLLEGADVMSELLRSGSSMSSVVSEKVAAIEQISFPISRSTSATSALSLSFSLSNTSSITKESPEGRAAAALPIVTSAFTPRAGLAVAEAEYNTINEQVDDMKLSIDDSQAASLNTLSVITGEERNTVTSAFAFTPRADLVVAEAEAKYNTIHDVQVDMKLSCDDTQGGSLNSFPLEETILDDPNEVSYSEPGTDVQMDMDIINSLHKCTKNSSAEESAAPTTVKANWSKGLLVKEYVHDDPTFAALSTCTRLGDASATAARKKVKWSSKLNDIRIFSTEVVGKKKKVKSTSLLQRLKKKNCAKEDHQQHDASGFLNGKI